MIQDSIIDGYVETLSDEMRAYWHSKGVSDDIIKDMRLGQGEIWGNTWLTIPIFDEQGKVEYLKLKAPPDGPVDQPKAMTFPKESTATLYPRMYLHKNLDTIVVAEGEPDVLCLLSHGIEAVCSTHGAGTFDEEWVLWFPDHCRVIFAYDADNPGQSGQAKVIKLFQAERPDITVAKIGWPPAVIKTKGDVSDWFTQEILRSNNND